jgi:cyclophilin family peptidyl-prolyl cis-trans isomerase
MPFLRSLTLLLAAAALTAASLVAQSKTDKGEKPKVKTANPVVIMKTSLGTIKIELFADKAPVSAKNFLAYVSEKFYDGTVFHRVMKNFMIQGGGFTAADPIAEKKTHDPIVNEAGNGVAHDRGTIAMARTNVVNSATSQFFINVKDNAFLNHKDETAGGFGYAVFGKVVDGMDVVDKIVNVQTGRAKAIATGPQGPTEAMFEDVPVTKVIIESVRLEAAAK